LGLQRFGLQHGSQHSGSGVQHLGSSQHCGSQQLDLQEDRQSNSPFKPPNRSQQDGLQHGSQQSGSQHSGSSQQAGSGVQHFATGSQQAVSLHASHAPHVPHPRLFSPSMRSSSSNPNA
jgi:hypothetical protein